MMMEMEKVNSARRERKTTRTTLFRMRGSSRQLGNSEIMRCQWFPVVPSGFSSYCSRRLGGTESCGTKTRQIHWPRLEQFPTCDLKVSLCC